MNATEAAISVKLARDTIRDREWWLEKIKNKCTHVYIDGTSAMEVIVEHSLAPDPSVDRCVACGWER